MNTKPRDHIQITQRYAASAKQIFDAWLDPAMASAWLFATASHPIARVEIDERVGGSFRFVDRRGGDEVEHVGKYVEIVRPRRLVFTLPMENSPKVVTRVTAEIVPLKKGCELRVVHENVPPDHARSTEGRWTGMLYGLRMMLRRVRGVKGISQRLTSPRHVTKSR